MIKHRKPMDPIWMIVVGVLLIIFHGIGKIVAIGAGIVIIILGVRRMIEHHKEKKSEQ